MHIVFSGSRTISDPVLIEYIVEDAHKELNSLGCSLDPGGNTYHVGDAAGVDHSIMRQISGPSYFLSLAKLTQHKADWRKLGKAAGVIRNERMLQTAFQDGMVDGTGSALVSIWNGTSPGTHHASKYAATLGMYQVCYVIQETLNGRLEATKTVYCGRNVLWTGSVDTPFAQPPFTTGEKEPDEQ